MSKFTAGPWRRDRYGVLVHGDNPLDAVQFRGVSICCGGSMVAEAEANTDLIATSPDLAAVLLAILAEVTPGPVPPYSADSHLPAHLIEQASAALEKAGAV